MKARIIGAVDGFGPSDQISGWAHLGDRSEAHAIRIEAFHDQTLIGEGRTDRYRRDIGGQHGFVLKLREPIDLDGVRGGRVRIRATAGDRTAELPFFGRLVELLSRQGAPASTPAAPPEPAPPQAPAPAPTTVAPAAPAKASAPLKPTPEDAELLALLRRHAGGSQGVRKRLALCLPYLADEGAELRLPGSPQGEVSALGVLPGSRSANDIAVVGRDGFLFIYGGSNDLYGQYRMDPDGEAVAEKADAWAGLFRARREALHGRGVRYLQMIVPEKSSLLPDLFPLPIPSPTPIMSALQARIAAAPALDAAYVDCLGALRASGRPREAFRQLDSHMRVQGNVVLFTALLRALGHHEEIAVDLARHAVFPSDLGGNFPGLPLREVLSFPRPNQFAEQEAALETLEFHRPEEPGKHLGSRCVWRNPAAPLDLRVVVFGNSFFERGAHATCLSWWGARWFRELHFLWAPEVDYAYVDRVRPDVVVGQTIERFLPVPPAA